MKKCIVFGNSYFSELLCEYLESYSEVEVEAFTVHGKYIQEKVFAGKPNVAFEQIENNYSPEKYTVLVALGYKNMNDLRKKVYADVIRKGYALQDFVHPDAKLYSNNIGKGNIILENVNVGLHVKIGDGNILWNGCNISHHSDIGNFNFFAPSAVTGGKVVVKNNCFVGINATIKGGIVVDDYTLIGAGAYLAKTSNQYDVYVPGNREKLENKKSLEMGL